MRNNLLSMPSNDLILVFIMIIIFVSMYLFAATFTLYSSVKFTRYIKIADKRLWGILLSKIDWVGIPLPKFISLIKPESIPVSFENDHSSDTHYLKLKSRVHLSRKLFYISFGLLSTGLLATAIIFISVF